LEELKLTPPDSKQILKGSRELEELKLTPPDSKQILKGSREFLLSKPNQGLVLLKTKDSKRILKRRVPPLGTEPGTSPFNPLKNKFKNYSS